MARATHFITGIGACALMLAPLSAQEREGAQDPARTRGTTHGTQDRTHLQDQQRSETTAHDQMVKGSDLIGKDVKNREGTDMGDVNDLAIDLKSGRVAYAIVSFGGFLGIGDKLVAVPFRALQPGPRGEHLILDVPREKLEKAPAFDKDKWPDMGDEEWGRTVHGFYGVDPYWNETGRPGQIGRVGDRDMDRARSGIGGEVADASLLVQKFNPSTVTTVTGRVVSIERPLGAATGARERTNYGPTGGVETGRAGAGERSGAGAGAGDRTGAGAEHGDRLGHSDAAKMAHGGSPVCVTLRTDTPLGNTSETGRVGETGRTGEAGRTGGAGETGRTGDTGRTAMGTTGQTVKVYLAPSQFLEAQNLDLKENDQLTVTGSRVDVRGDTAIIATQVRKEDQVVKLRSDNGAPMWGEAASPPAGGRR